MKNNKTSIIALLTAFLATASVNLYAALPAAATTAFTTLGDDAQDLIDAAWPVVIAVTAAFIVIRLFKRAAKSAV